MEPPSGPDGATDTAHAVEHLSEYYRHMTTVSAGAIVVVSAFAGLTTAPAFPVLAALAVGSLALCVLASTFMMWAYGAARREAAKALGERPGSWAYEVSPGSLDLARDWVNLGSRVAPTSFIAGFLLLATYAIVSLF
jgi:hypothetical protein